MKDKIVLITGSTDGIGKQTAVDLSRMEAKVIVHGRNEQKAKDAMVDIAHQTGNQNLEYVKADLASMDQIRNMAEEIKVKYDRIDILINNAGVFMNRRELSHDGFEMTFAVNHISYFLLTGLLLDLIKESKYARIVNVASQAHASNLDFDNLQGEKYFEGYDAYSRSKLGNILFTYKLARMLQGSHITTNVLHPGVIRTKLLNAGWGGGGTSLEQGAKTSIYLAASPEILGISGKYFANGRMARSSEISYDSSVQDKLWQRCEEYVNMKY
jgi:NAD(P)-dependent dehydrogenase (short-subunit alcohol dehydrogenase family)